MTCRRRHRCRERALADAVPPACAGALSEYHRQPPARQARLHTLHALRTAYAHLATRCLFSGRRPSHACHAGCAAALRPLSRRRTALGPTRAGRAGPPACGVLTCPVGFRPFCLQVDARVESRPFCSRDDEASLSVTPRAAARSPVPICPWHGRWFGFRGADRPANSPAASHLSTLSYHTGHVLSRNQP